MGFEEKVAKKYNRYMAKRKPLSGGIEGFEGDVETVETLIECKERNQKTGGDKSISVKKKWLERIEDEALKHDKLPVLVFRYKSDPEDLYYTMNFDYLLELLHRLKYNKDRVDELKKENEKLKKEIKELKDE